MKEGAQQNTERMFNKVEKAPTMLAEYERYRNLPPTVITKKHLSLEEVAQKEGVDIKKLEADLQIKIDQFVAKMAKTSSYPSEEYFGLIDSFYNLYLEAQNPELIKENSWLSAFKSFTAFAEHFCPEATPHAKSAIKKNIQIFVKAIVNQEEIISIHPRDWLGVNSEGVKEVYNSEGDWVLLPSEYNASGVFDYVSREVVEEIIKLVAENHHYSDFTHSSGSAALEGIARSQAILSAQEIARRNMKVSTGEHVSYVGQESGLPVAGGKHGLGSVYASGHGQTSGYNHINWFNEYYVSFGINKKKQEDFLKDSGFKYDWASSEDNPAYTLDLGSEGIEIGSKVPLRNVELVYYWKRHQAEMAIWVKENCPQAKMVSIEAAEVMNMSSHVIEKIASQEKISPLEVWKKIIEK